MTTTLNAYVQYTESLLDLELNGADWRTKAGHSELSAVKSVRDYWSIRNKLEEFILEQAVETDENARIKFLAILGIKAVPIDTRKLFDSPVEAMNHKIE